MTVVDSKGRSFDSIEEMMDDYERNMTIWQRVDRFVYRRVTNPARNAKNAVKWAYQRVVRGWDDQAVWDINTSLASSLGEQLVEMARICHGYPPAYGEKAALRWVADNLASLSD